IRVLCIHDLCVYHVLWSSDEHVHLVCVVRLCILRLPCCACVVLCSNSPGCCCCGCCCCCLWLWTTVRRKSCARCSSRRRGLRRCVAFSRDTRTSKSDR